MDTFEHLISFDFLSEMLPFVATFNSDIFLYTELPLGMYMKFNGN